MATEPFGWSEDLSEAVTRARHQAAHSGELLPPDAPGYEAKVDADVQEFILSILRDGTYAGAAPELAQHDRDLATQ